MNSLRLFPIAAALLSWVTAGHAQTGFPFQSESLHYTINWPSGLGVGDATFTASKTTAGWSLGMTLQAGIPGIAVSDKIASTATAELCSLSLNRNLAHGPRKSEEKTTFDQAKGVARRVTVMPAGGGSSELSIPSCARDALAFFYFTRKELGQGRVPPQTRAFFGSEYSVRMEYTGAQTITVGERPAVTDRVVVYVKGPKSDFSFETYYARDAARTPLLVKVPFSAGTFSMELVR